MIYTSSYTRKGDDPTAISISYSITPGTRERCNDNIRHLRQLGPSGELLIKYKRHLITNAQYTDIYIGLLEQRKLTPERILDMLPGDCYLLCYEKPNEFCHRRLLANYVYKGTGVMFPEWVSEKQSQKIERQAVQQVNVDSLLAF
jgi:hypothetical protein